MQLDIRDETFVVDSTRKRLFKSIDMSIRLNYFLRFIITREIIGKSIEVKHRSKDMTLKTAVRSHHFLSDRDVVLH